MSYSVRLGLVALACAGAALAGCGSQRAAVPATAMAGSSASVTAAAQTPAQQAAADAAALLAAFPVPPGAMRTAALPVPWLGASPEPLTGPDVVTRTGWWRVPGQPATVLGWIRAHMPAGFSLELSGSAAGAHPRIVVEPAFPIGGRTQPSARMWFAQFTKPPVPNVLATRWLVVSVAANATGQTAIRVDSEVAWARTKPSAERIPAAATVVTIAPVLGSGPIPAADAPVTITDPAKVARIASVVNGLQMFPVGHMMCPMIRGTGMRLTFRAAAAAPALAVVTASSTGCQTVAVTVSGRQYPMLAGALGMEQQVMTIAGVRWPGFPGSWQ